jgi:eukaryotic-like serine/threonine-protein kinase
VTRGLREAAVVALVVLGSLAATVGILKSTRSDTPRARAERASLGFSDTSRSCEGCHPRHTAEWRRSVMAHASRSPLFQSLELLIEEQVGRSADCPEGAGVLRRQGSDECRDPKSGLVVTGSGGEGWCVSCHAPGENLGRRQPSWNSRSEGPDNRPLAELLSPAGLEGIGCTACHQTHGPVTPGASARGNYEGNPSWKSFETGSVFSFRPTPNDRRFGISNSGYRLEPAVLLAGVSPAAELVAGGAHRRVDVETRAYLGSSEFCGSCHDVRLFGTDAIGQEKGEHFKRLRNAYSEWLDFAAERKRQGRSEPSCQACHMSSFPGVCVATDETQPGATTAKPSGPGGCPPGTRLSPRDPGELPRGLVAAASDVEKPLHPHYFSGVDVPLGETFDLELAGESSLDSAGIPLGVRARRDLLLARAVRLDLGSIERRGRTLEIPVTIENVGGGHRVPAGFSQERELWVHLSVTDVRGRLLYEVGRVERDDEDLHDKVFLRVTTDERSRDALGRPLGLFGADVADGPDAPRWDPPPEFGGRVFRGKGLVNFQNGFLRCVRCIGRIGASGACEALSGQERARADRFDDGEYDPDTGRCTSNLFGRAALFETYFPVGALDATRGVLKAPDAIIDTRSLAPEAPVTYVYELPAARGPVRVEARLLFRAFPPYLVRAFADYERDRAERGERTRGPLVTERMLERIEVVELARVERRGG